MLHRHAIHSQTLINHYGDETLTHSALIPSPSLPELSYDRRSWGQWSLRLGKDSSYCTLNRISKQLRFNTKPDGALAGGLDSLPAGLKSLEDRSALIACYVQERGRVGVAMNRAFEQQLMSQGEALTELGEMHCLPLFLWGW